MTTASSTRAFYGLVQAGDWLGGLSERTVRRLIERGELHAVRIGRRVVIPAEELDRFAQRLLDPAYRFRIHGDATPASAAPSPAAPSAPAAALTPPGAAAGALRRSA